MDLLDKEILEFLEDNIDLIDEGRWKDFYDSAAESTLFHHVGKITDVLLDSGINPLENSTEIFDNMFVRSKIKHLNIPAAIQTIGISAFYDSTIEEVTIPEGVQEIPMECFEECTHLHTITIPSSVTYIAPDAIWEDAVIVCPPGSFAAFWGEKRGFEVRLNDENR